MKTIYPPESMDDENGNCKRCGHPFNPHIIIAYDGNDFSKGGEMRCQVEGCECFSTVSFNFTDEQADAPKSKTIDTSHLDKNL